jgi:hypothetical protein
MLVNYCSWNAISVQFRNRWHQGIKPIREGYETSPAQTILFARTIRNEYHDLHIWRHRIGSYHDEKTSKKNPQAAVSGRWSTRIASVKSTREQNTICFKLSSTLAVTFT